VKNETVTKEEIPPRRKDWLTLPFPIKAGSSLDWSLRKECGLRVRVPRRHISLCLPSEYSSADIPYTGHTPSAPEGKEHSGHSGVLVYSVQHSTAVKSSSSHEKYLPSGDGQQIIEHLTNVCSMLIALPCFILCSQQPPSK
jgi:hypothetical protein